MAKNSKGERPQTHEPWVGFAQFEKWKREAASKDYADKAFEILHAAGTLTRQGYLEMMLVMDEMYPGWEWREQMDELEAFYCKYSLALKERPRIERIEEFISNPHTPQ